MQTAAFILTGRVVPLNRSDDFDHFLILSAQISTRTQRKDYCLGSRNHTRLSEFVTVNPSSE